MIATAADRSLMESPQLARMGGRNSFFWTMVAFAVLDVLMLFWILNPLANEKNDTIPGRPSTSQVRSTSGDAGSKRSPLGSVATHLKPKVSRNRNNFTTVAYDAR